MAAVYVHEVAPLTVPDGGLMARLIPPGACVVTDQISDLISADRFNVPPGCPDVIDSLATTLSGDDSVDLESGTLEITSSIGGTGSLTILGGTGGILVLDDTNAYTGDTTLQGGTVEFDTALISLAPSLMMPPCS